jgi:hypothetical protein
MLKIDQQCIEVPSPFEIVQCLSEVLVCEGLHTLKFEDELVVHEDVDVILTHILALICDSKRHLRLSSNASQSKLSN